VWWAAPWWVAGWLVMIRVEGFAGLGFAVALACRKYIDRRL
jgi:hypothetical protein